MLWKGITQRCLVTKAVIFCMRCVVYCVSQKSFCDAWKALHISDTRTILLLLGELGVRVQVGKLVLLHVILHSSYQRRDVWGVGGSL